MMISPNQRKAIQDVVDRGEALTVEMGSALLAAFHEAQNGHINVAQQLSDSEREKSRLQWTRDETVRLHRQLEKEIDERLVSRTEEIRAELRLARAGQERAESSAQFYENLYQTERKEWQSEQSKLIGMINELKGLVEQQMPESFMKRLGWKRAARRVLKKADRLNPRQY